MRARSSVVDWVEIMTETAGQTASGVNAALSR
jgi:hypothetical protein